MSEDIVGRWKKLDLELLEKAEKVYNIQIKDLQERYRDLYSKIYRFEKEYLVLLTALLGFIKLLGEFLKPSKELEIITMVAGISIVTIAWFYSRMHILKELEDIEKILNAFSKSIIEDPMPLDKGYYKKMTIILIAYSIVMTILFLLW